MSEMFTQCHYEVFELMSQSKLSHALERIDEAERTGELDSVLRMLKTYILVEMQDYTHAEKLAVVEDSKFVYFIKKIYKALNRIMDYKRISKNSHEEQYDAALLSDDFELAKSAGIKLLQTNPIYLVFALVLLCEQTRDDADLKLLRLALRKCPPYPNIFIMMVKLDVLVDYVVDAVGRAHVKNLTYLYLLKEVFMRYAKYRQNIVDVLAEPFNVSGETQAMEFFIERFDDWGIYEEALAGNIELRESNTLNHSLYRIRRNSDASYAAEVCLRLDSLKTLFHVFDFADVRDRLPDNLRILFDARRGFCEDDLRKIYGIYTSNMSFMNTKILLLCLISSRCEPYLVLALYVARNMYSMFNTYEIKLIYLFLCRFLCIESEVLRVIQDLDIRNIQEENLAFMWSDLGIVLEVCNHRKITKYLNTHIDAIRKINDYVYLFVGAGKLDHAFDLLVLRKKLVGSVVYKEVRSQAIASTCPENMFTDFLGPTCSYLFAKLTVNHEKNTLKLRNIFGDAQENSVGKFLANDLMDLRDNTEFTAWLASVGLKL